MVDLDLKGRDQKIIIKQWSEDDEKYLKDEEKEVEKKTVHKKKTKKLNTEIDEDEALVKIIVNLEFNKDSNSKNNAVNDITNHLSQYTTNKLSVEEEKALRQVVTEWLENFFTEND